MQRFSAARRAKRKRAKCTATRLRHDPVPPSLAIEFLNWLLPRRCAACGETTRDVLCPPCYRAIPWIDIPEARPYAAVWYEGPAEAWIRRFKYPSGVFRGLDPAVPAVIGVFLERACNGIDPAGWDAVVPIPSTAQRIRQRGFFPAANLARGVARRLGLPYRPKLLRLVGEPTSQTTLGREERLSNLRGVFRASERSPSQVLLIDDVSTTGATLAEAARVLRRAGARRVAGCCLARSRVKRAEALPRPPQ